tara:strand:- start:152058 stop:153383 length:1326 start_codon:yes stop_codon:yes gene_type:complete
MINAIKNLLSIAVGMMTIRFAQTLTTFIMMVILAQLGHTALAASFTIGMLRVVIMLIFMAPLFSLGAIVGRQFASNQQQVLPSVLRQAWLVALAIGIPATIVVACIKPILIATHQPPAVTPLVWDYFKYFLIAMPIFYLNIANQQFLAGSKRQNIVAIISLLTIVIATILNLGFVLGYFGFPQYGVEGAGIATLLGASISFIITSYVVIKHVGKPLFKQPHLDFTWFKLILKVGMPICFKISGDMLMKLAFTILVGWLGVTAMAASQISNEYMLLLIVPVFGLSEACAIAISHVNGEHKQERMRQLGNASMLTATVLTIGAGILFAIFHRPLASVFIHFNSSGAEAIYVLAMWLLVIRVLTMFFDGIEMSLIGCLRGLYDTQFPMWLAIGMNWLITVPLAYILGFTLHMGVIGIALSIVIARCFSTTAIVLRWRWQLHRCQ